MYAFLYVATVESPEIKAVLKYAFDLSQKHIQRVTQIFNDEAHPIPKGFTDQDVNVRASRLYSDSFILSYASHMGAMGLNAEN